jgi:hypothetical protein
MNWLSRNVRLAIWIHAVFLLVLSLCLAPSPIDAIATWGLLTLFLPHFLIAQKFGGFTSDVGSLHAIIVLSIVSFALAFPISLVYASLLHWIGGRIRRYRRSRHESRASV